MSWNERSGRRLELILEAINLGLSADEADDFLEKGLKELGPESEQRAIEVISDIAIVESVSKASETDDHRGKDLWVTYTQDSEHTDTSVEVKSSWAAARAFILERRSKGRKSLIESRRIVLNAGPQVSHSKIRRSFLSQLKRMDGYIYRRED